VEDNSYYYNNLGNSFMDIGKYEEALENYMKAISVKNDEAIFYHNSGVCLMLMEEYNRAKSLFKKALELSINMDETKYYYIKCIFETNDSENLENIDFPDDKGYLIESLVMISKMSMRNGKKEIAKKCLNMLKILGYSSQETDLIEKMI